MWHGYDIFSGFVRLLGRLQSLFPAAYFWPCQSCTEQKRRPNQPLVMVRWNRKQSQCNWSLHRFNWLNPSISSLTITMTSGKLFLHAVSFVRFKFFDVLYWWSSWKSPLPTLYLNPSSFWIFHLLKAYPLWPQLLQTKTLMFCIN